MIGKDDEVREVYYITHTVKIRGAPPKAAIKAWSWDKDITKKYLEFHGSPNMKLNSYVGTVGEIAEMLEESATCEIKIALLKTRDPKHSERFRHVYTPVTEQEMMLLRSHESTACSDMVHKFDDLQDMFYRLKDKYQDALRLLLLEEMIRRATGRPSKIVESISYDEIRLLVHDNPDDFA